MYFWSAAWLNRYDTNPFKPSLGDKTVKVEPYVICNRCDLIRQKITIL